MGNILWISACVPYDKVPHAGGKIENFYIKGLKNELPVELVTFADSAEMPDVDLREYGIKADIYLFPEWGLRKIIFGVANRLRRYNPFSKKIMLSPFQELCIKKNLIERSKKMKKPSVIIIEWTQMIMLSSWIKILFPDVPIIAIEEDVSFLSYERRYLNENNRFMKLYKKKQYLTLRKSELEQLSISDFIIVNNYKDYNLLIENNINKNKLWTWTPYFQSMIDLDYIGDSKDVLFYGAMNRYENYASAIWFIENVLPKVDVSVRLVILGGNPHASLKKYAGERVVITGFVDDIQPYFQHSLCLVAPLVLGAGVKIKIIESLSAGLPILTNDIGIEGIPAENRKTYFHCDSPEDYVKIIHFLLKNADKKMQMSMAEKNLVKEIYDCDKSLKEFIKKVKSISNQK